MQYIFDFQNGLWKNKLNVMVPLLSLGLLASETPLHFCGCMGLGYSSQMIFNSAFMW